MKHLSTLVVALFMASTIIAAQKEDNQKSAAAEESAQKKTVAQKEVKADNQKPVAVKQPLPAENAAKKEVKAADQKPVAAKEPAQAKTVAKKEAKPADKGVSKFMGGTIVAVDAPKNVIFIRVKSNDYPVLIVPETDLAAQDNKISFADLKKGDYISVNYLKFKNGERHAQKINNKTFAAKLAKMESTQKQEQKKEPAQKANVQPKAQVVPAQKQAVKANPEQKAKTAPDKEANPEVKKETKQETK